MWIYIKSLFMVKDRQIAKEMVKHLNRAPKPAGFKLARLMRRRARRNRFKADNSTNLKYKVK
ncbi:hypothetical protein GCM10011365_22380 [Marinicella pacifica]|uniref:Uncharacterized protein n=1 Tax=Marinicella pacifica TaxID=1171543 RepID=A0A917CY17_9GAMM|nr:hypothetical protein GCM10011365_22380 [Marinicella pacifica]